MRVSTVLAILLVCLAFQGCGHPSWKNDSEADKASPPPPVLPTSEAIKPVDVHLMDRDSQKDIWVVATTREHITYLPETGTIQIDGQLWRGPYKVTDHK